MFDNAIIEIIWTKIQTGKNKEKFDFQRIPFFFYEKIRINSRLNIK